MYLFFDTETNGKADFKLPSSHASQPYPVQIAAVLTDDSGVERGCMAVLVTPDGWDIPAEVQAIHGITPGIALNFGVPMLCALSMFRFLAAQAETLVAHNIRFDEIVMEAAYLRVGKPSPLSGMARFCTMAATTPICKLRGNYGYKWPKLEEAHRHFFGTGLEGAHDALVDVRACIRVFFELRKLEAAK